MTTFVGNHDGTTTRGDPSSPSARGDPRPDLKFPCKLYTMLMAAETQGFADIVSWHPDGTSFRIHQPDAFVTTILPVYFHKQSQYRSFQRQCNLYGFYRSTAVRPFWEACYQHPLFTKEDTDCCTKLTRPLRDNKNRTKKTRVLSIDTRVLTKNNNNTILSPSTVSSEDTTVPASLGNELLLPIPVHATTTRRRTSYQELCTTILGEDCDLCEDNGQQLLQNIIHT